jgi:uncharacterized damage-inducible protein DinB
MSIAQMLLPEYDQEMANTRKILERLPDGKFDYKPHEKSMALGRLAGHISELPTYATITMTTDSFDVPDNYQPLVPTTKKQVLESFDKNAAEARAAIASATDEQMLKVWSLRARGKEMFSMPRAAVLRTMVMSHLVHHRAQLGVYLRLNNVEIPGMYGPSADDMKSMQAQGA